MTEQNKIEDVERVEIEPAGGDNVDAPEGNEPEGAVGAVPASEHQPKEQLVVHQKPEKPADENENGGSGTLDPAPVEGETPREHALRLEAEGLRTKLRERQREDLGITTAPQSSKKKELAPEKQEVLKKYKPEEIESLREVLPVLAEEMGYVRTDELSAQQYTDRSQGELDDFLKDHKEYLPENDKDGILWNRFKEEFAVFKQPANPKDYRKIFNRIHTDIFGIKPVGDKGPIIAAQQKISVASHAGASGPSRSVITPVRKTNTTGLRLDMLKGFSEEDLASMQGE